LLVHSWSGNIRELQNAIERALIVAEDGLISPEHLGIVLRPPRDATIPAFTAPKDDASTLLTLAAQEKRAIVEALQRTHGH
jgi:DNA-binding NtrC family response regulator